MIEPLAMLGEELPAVHGGEAHDLRLPLPLLPAAPALEPLPPQIDSPEAPEGQDHAVIRAHHHGSLVHVSHDRIEPAGVTHEGIGVQDQDEVPARVPDPEVEAVPVIRLVGRVLEEANPGKALQVALVYFRRDLRQSLVCVGVL